MQIEKGEPIPPGSPRRKEFAKLNHLIYIAKESSAEEWFDLLEQADGKTLLEMLPKHFDFSNIHRYPPIHSVTKRIAQEMALDHAKLPEATEYVQWAKWILYSVIRRSYSRMFDRQWFLASHKCDIEWRNFIIGVEYENVSKQTQKLVEVSDFFVLSKYGHVEVCVVLDNRCHT